MQEAHWVKSREESKKLVEEAGSLAPSKLPKHAATKLASRSKATLTLHC